MLSLKIASFEEEIFNEKVDKVTIKTISGVITVLPKHIPLISAIKDGYCIVNNKKTMIKKAIVTVNSDSSVYILIEQ